MAMDNLEWLEWHVEYARKEQHERLAEHLKEEGTTIGEFLTTNACEWQLDSLLRSVNHYLPKVRAELEEAQKPRWYEFWKK